MTLTKEQNERIATLQNNFKRDNEFGNSNRQNILTKIETLRSVYDAKVKAFDNREELDGVESMMFAEYISLASLLLDIWNEVIKLDNYRCSSIQQLVNLLLYSDLNKKLIKEVKEYEY